MKFLVIDRSAKVVLHEPWTTFVEDYISHCYWPPKRTNHFQQVLMVAFSKADSKTSLSTDPLLTKGVL